MNNTEFCKMPIDHTGVEELKASLEALPKGWQNATGDKGREVSESLRGIGFASMHYIPASFTVLTRVDNGFFGAYRYAVCRADDGAIFVAVHPDRKGWRTLTATSYPLPLQVIARRAEKVMAKS
jgi:hypothetical protein